MVHKISSLKISDEDKLLLLCARTRITEEVKEKIKSTVQQQLDWNYILQRSFKHKLTPLLYWQLNSLCHDSISPEVMDTLKTYFHENAHKNLLYLGELQKILKLFENSGIDAIPYKGPTLAISVYGNLALREFVDLDIFINQNDVIKAKKMLVSEFYKPYIYLDPIKEKKFVETQHDYGFTNDEKSVTIELHWRFTSLLFSLPIDEKEVFNVNDKNYAFINNHKIRSLNPEDLFLILCIHNSEHRWSRLAWICDIAEFVQHNCNINWEKIIRKAKRIGIFRILLINLNLAKDLFDLKIQDERIVYYLKNDDNVEEISNQIKTNIFIKKHDKVALLREISLNIKVRDKIFRGIIDCILGAVKPTTYEWKNIALPSIFYPFYYLLRPFMLLKRYKIR